MLTRLYRFPIAPNWSNSPPYCAAPVRVGLSLNFDLQNFYTMFYNYQFLMGLNYCRKTYEEIGKMTKFCG